MKHRNRARSSSLFLMELILAILFFSLASAICVQIFVTSHRLNADSEVLNYSVNECCGLAEIVDASRSLEECVSLLHEVYPEAHISEISPTQFKMLIWYDDTLSMCEANDGSYALSIRLAQKDYMINTVIDFSTASGEPVYQLETTHHIARQVTDERGVTDEIE